MIKTLIIKETKDHILFKLSVVTQRGTAVTEVARFRNSGMGWCLMGASGRYMLQHFMLDNIEFCGKEETYKRLVDLGIIIQ